MRILICDDELDFVNMLKNKVEQLAMGKKIDIMTVVSGKEIFKQKGLEKLDAVFLDIEMPGMDGIKVADELRKFNQYMHILFCLNVLSNLL